MFGTDIRVDDLPALPPALRDALTEGMVSLMWDEIPEQRLGGYSLAGSDRLDALASEAERPSLSWFSLVLTGLAKEPVAFQLGCDRSALLDALAGGLAAPRQIHEGLKEHLHAEAAFTLGSARLLISELKALEVGAVIVLPAIDAGVCSVRVEGSVYDFRPNGAGWALVGSAASDRDAEQAIASRGDGSMASEPDEPHGQESAGLSSLPIMIDFDLGRRTVPLSEIESWHAGSIVALDPPPRADGVEVTLRANGRVIGIGDLVRIDDRLAVRLSRLLFTP
jgi:type III secretion system YscQ/HrcQ family protein